MTDLEKLKAENQLLEREIAYLEKHRHNLEQVLSEITSAKTFRFWQRLVEKKKEIRDFILDFKNKSGNFRRALENQLRYLRLQLLLRKGIVQSDYSLSVSDASSKARKRLGKERGVTVIMPAKDPPESFEEVIRRYKDQQGVKTEIIIIDSGVGDKVFKIAKNYNCRHYKIKPSQFHHGKTRNLGIELAKNEFVVNTVTDAVPVSRSLLIEVIDFLEKNKCAAVSVRQIPYRDADYFAQWMMFNHYSFLFPKQKTDNVYKKPPNFENLHPGIKRRLCLLDDVFTLHKAKIIKKEKYSDKIEYAEDLEYSLRLLKKGYKLGFLNSKAVIHSHTRPSEYFLKRYFVDTISISQIVGQRPENLLGFKKELLNIKGNKAIIKFLLRSFMLRLEEWPLSVSVPKKYIGKRRGVKLNQLTKIFLESLYKTVGIKNNKMSLRSDVLESFDLTLKYSINKFLEFVDSITTDENERDLALKESYIKILFMTLGVNLAEICLYHENTKSAYHQKIRKFLYTGV